LHRQKAGPYPTYHRKRHVPWETNRIRDELESEQEKPKYDWSKSLCRLEQEDLEKYPPKLQVFCPKCSFVQTWARPQWTIHEPARLVAPRFKCVSCRRPDQYLKPVDSQISIIRSEKLSKLYNDFLAEGCELAAFPKIAEIIFDFDSGVNPKRHPQSIKKRIDRLKEAKKCYGG
jgi:hypothetical protein